MNLVNIILMREREEGREGGGTEREVGILMDGIHFFGRSTYGKEKILPCSAFFLFFKCNF